MPRYNDSIGTIIDRELFTGSNGDVDLEDRIDDDLYKYAKRYVFPLVKSMFNLQGNDLYRLSFIKGNPSDVLAHTMNCMYYLMPYLSYKKVKENVYGVKNLGGGTAVIKLENCMLGLPTARQLNRVYKVCSEVYRKFSIREQKNDLYSKGAYSKFCKALNKCVNKFGKEYSSERRKLQSHHDAQYTFDFIFFYIPEFLEEYAKELDKVTKTYL